MLLITILEEMLLLAIRRPMECVTIGVDNCNEMEEKKTGREEL